MEGIRRRRVSRSKEDADVDAASTVSDDDVKPLKVEGPSDSDVALVAGHVGTIDYICSFSLLVVAFAVRVYHISAIDTVIFDEVGSIKRFFEGFHSSCWRSFQSHMYSFTQSDCLLTSAVVYLFFRD
jgi:hypothetical protein